MKPSLAIGDKLTRPKVAGIINHVGVLIGPNLVLTNTPEKGEHACTLEEFSAGQPVTVERTGASLSDVIARSREILANPKRYHALLNNCEHSVNRLLYGKAQSLQVRVAAVVAFLGLIFCRAR